MGATLSAAKVGANLKRLIKMSKYHTTENFAKAYGANVCFINMLIENGTSSLNVVSRLATTLGVDGFALLV